MNFIFDLFFLFYFAFFFIFILPKKTNFFFFFFQSFHFHFYKIPKKKNNNKKMKKNTLIQSLAFADIDHKNTKHDSAVHFIKQPHILKSIIESLHVNYPTFYNNELVGMGYQSKLPLNDTKLKTVLNIHLETEAVITKGSNKDNKYAIGFMDGILEFEAEYQGFCLKQLLHIEQEVEITLDEIKLIQAKKHQLYYQIVSSEKNCTKNQIFYHQGQKLIIDVLTNMNHFLIYNGVYYYLTTNSYLLNRANEFCMCANNEKLKVLAVIQSASEPKKGKVYEITEHNQWIVLWENDPKGLCVQFNNGSFYIVESFFTVPKTTCGSNNSILNLNLSEKLHVSYIQTLDTKKTFFLNDKGMFEDFGHELLQSFTIQNNNHHDQNNLYLVKCLTQNWEKEPSLCQTPKQKQMFRIETKFHPTSASDIIRQIKLYDEYLPNKQHWLVLTFFQLSNLEQEELKAAGLHWILLGGPTFYNWYNAKQSEEPMIASIYL